MAAWFLRQARIAASRSRWVPVRAARGCARTAPASSARTTTTLQRVSASTRRAAVLATRSRAHRTRAALLASNAAAYSETSF